MTGAELAARFPGSKRSGTGWRAPCLAHGSKGGTLSIGEGRDGRLLLKCFAGCEATEIAAAVGLELRDLMGQAANDQWSAVRPHRQPTRGEIREALRAAATGYRADHRLDAADRLVAADVNAIRHAVAARLGVSLPPVEQRCADSAAGGRERDQLWPLLLERAWRELWIERDSSEPCCSIELFATHGDLGFRLLEEAETRAAGEIASIVANAERESERAA